jgi:hypothetical protein
LGERGGEGGLLLGWVGLGAAGGVEGGWRERGRLEGDGAAGLRLGCGWAAAGLRLGCGWAGLGPAAAGARSHQHSPCCCPPACCCCCRRSTRRRPRRRSERAVLELEFTRAAWILRGQRLAVWRRLQRRSVGGCSFRGLCARAEAERVGVIVWKSAGAGWGELPCACFVHDCSIVVRETSGRELPLMTAGGTAALKGMLQMRGDAGPTIKQVDGGHVLSNQVFVTRLVPDACTPVSR